LIRLLKFGLNLFATRKLLAAEEKIMVNEMTNPKKPKSYPCSDSRNLFSDVFLNCA